MSAREALARATLGGARAIHMDQEIGSLEVGKRADVLVVDIGGVHQQPLYDVYSVLAYATKASDVETVIVEGRLLYDRGRFLTLDVEEVLAKAAEYRDQVRRSLSKNRHSPLD